MPNENVTALKDYFNLWLECGEKAYAELAFTEEYARNFAGLVNACLALRRKPDDGPDTRTDGLSLPLPPGFAGLAAAAPVEVGPSPRDEVYREDKLRLYRYRAQVAEPHGVPVLIVFALVNKPWIMDLEDGRSLIQGLLRAGLDVYLIDWGCPDEGDVALTLDDYVNRYLDHAVDCIRRRHGDRPINLLGVCQGGTFCLCYAARRQHKVAGLVTSVTPVDFHTPQDLLSHLIRHVDMDLVVDNVPGAWLNALFLLLRPFRLTGKKYLDLLEILEDRERVATFMRMEQWIFDSPDQAAAACRQFAVDFYQQNKLVQGEAQIGGKRVDLGAITIPVLNVLAANDHLVPVAASKALAGCVGSEDYTELEVPGGHVGIHVGARGTLPAAISDWVRTRQA